VGFQPDPVAASGKTGNRRVRVMVNRVILRVEDQFIESFRNTSMSGKALLLDARKGDGINKYFPRTFLTLSKKQVALTTLPEPANRHQRQPLHNNRKLHSI
jgi:hypothetical protein